MNARLAPKNGRTAPNAERALLAGLSATCAFEFKFVERLVVEALVDRSCCSGDARVVLEALEMESRILWNFRLVVLSATDIVIYRLGCCTVVAKPSENDSIFHGGDDGFRGSKYQSQTMTVDAAILALARNQ